MVAALSPSMADYEETLSTLRFAKSAKKVQTRAVVNEVHEGNVEAQLRAELEKMQEKLRAMECKGESNGVTAVFNGEQQPVKITVSDEAMKAGRAVVQDAVVEAINQAMQESQKAMQTTMMDMQKELMSTLQAQQKK